MRSSLWTWSAVELARAIRQKEVSAREALQSCMQRLEQVNPYLNAIVDPLSDDAIRAADAADAAVNLGAPLGPLHGVPVTIKINVDYAGRATTNGVVAFQHVIASADSPVVSNLRKAGAVIFGRTNVPCFSTRLFTDNDLYGRTYNPWDPARTPGGSSGGAAAAVATGMGFIGHGNDRAGSIRFPAYACGVYGFRPSPGQIPEYNPTANEERRSHLAADQYSRSADALRCGCEACIACHVSARRSRPVVATSLRRPERDYRSVSRCFVYGNARRQGGSCGRSGGSRHRQVAGGSGLRG